MEEHLTDRELLELLHQEPERAVEHLFRRYFSLLCGVVYKLIPDARLAEDLTQEVFFELWRKRADLRLHTSFGAYLRRAAINRTLNYLRDHRQELAHQSLAGEKRSQALLPDAGLELDDLQQKLDAAIDRLPERCRLIFLLSRFDDMSYKEIADKLGISVKTVENQIVKALRLLRQALEEP